MVVPALLTIILFSEVVPVPLKAKPVNTLSVPAASVYVPSLIKNDALEDTYTLPLATTFVPAAIFMVLPVLPTAKAVKDALIAAARKRRYLISVFLSFDFLPVLINMYY